MKEGFPHATDAGIRLTEFLRDRFDDDNHAALACIERVGPERAGDPYSDGSGIADRDAFPSYPWGSNDAELAYMAGPGHPARVLADVTAKHAILDTITQFLPISLNPMTPAGVVALALAQPYADHPDFDPAWKTAQG